MPVDSAWKTLDPLERLYLESEFATDDLLRILDMHAVVEKSVRWSDTLDGDVTRKWPSIHAVTVLTLGVQ
jgi:solute carrier family 25 (mitochondrial carnitine/acylcarnitine transporter), member 20/29